VPLHSSALGEDARCQRRHGRQRWGKGGDALYRVTMQGSVPRPGIVHGSDASDTSRSISLLMSRPRSLAAAEGGGHGTESRQ
jgi:hypothetical protein